jgi:divalent metal cation (Fe/Co/Zn/Cd) transporter
MIGLVLAVVAFVLARTSRGLLLGEAANPKTVAAIVEAIESHPNVVKVVELLTMHLAPKQILINAHINVRDDLVTGEIVKTVEEVEELIKRTEPKVEMIFLETARQCDSSEQDCVPEHVG